MRDDWFEFRFLGIYGRAKGRFAIIVMAGLLTMAMTVAFVVLGTRL